MAPRGRRAAAHLPSLGFCVKSLSLGPELFLAVLGASSLTYAEATATQQSRDFIASHTHALEYFEGVPEVTIPDQLESGVSHACPTAS